jgi:hypothetical protein
MRKIAIATILFLCLAVSGWADGIIYGNFTYKGCNCTGSLYGDKVHIWQSGPGGWNYWAAVSCDPFYPPHNTYSTDPETIPPGWYYIAVYLDEVHSECDKALIKYIYHGLIDQQIDLEVRGSAGNPENNGGGED